VPSNLAHAVAIALAALCFSTSAAAQAQGWAVDRSARPGLVELWQLSTQERRERVACLGGRLDADSVVVSSVRLLHTDGYTSDSLSASATASIQDCGRPDWIGTVHTHVRSTDDSVPARRFSSGDRMVMSEWTRRWGGQGAFCVLYSERGAHCEVYPPRR
jgi:hypothetical protein